MTVRKHSIEFTYDLLANREGKYTQVEAACEKYPICEDEAGYNSGGSSSPSKNEHKTMHRRRDNYKGSNGVNG